ncbi:PhzF family phenazine biosynthesis protein [Aquibacillus koreensis]|uniref:PhzF family phenazine biosynthesis protein n=1 Tax=Aquibacillus koreensis TaxID=279446 RepID=A0A9X3WMP7_9BACI|nr:PhzF family phenazine biosynthesis protein [Aquibacillus koreensis]MCT2535152.1 PhzF family phenazine biosynthesis protein [Aquibacillus koreensis]MDC3421011.1 PhzF family phenazine biosynthesis protein [Aquibacillus koreensis]
MKNIPVYHVDAFTDQAFGGNPAGVVPEASDLTEKEMQNIASELNLSETAFLYHSDSPDADYRIRYFTPAEEIDFCGHATIATAWILATKYAWADRTNQVVLQTNGGLVPVKWVKEHGRLTAVSMTQLPPKTNDIVEDPTAIASLLGIKPSDLDEQFPIKMSNTGVWHLLVPVKTRVAIDKAQPKLNELANMNKRYNISTTHLFTFNTDDKNLDLYTRDFCPAIGIKEDPVTGAANGALAGYLYLEGVLDATKTHALMIGQGHAMNRPGFLSVTVTPQEDYPRIEVAGSAVITIEGTMTL